MEFASKKKIITPGFSFLQQGFAARHDVWTKVHDDIYASVAVISANTAVVFISLDLLSGDRQFEQDLYTAVFDKFDIPANNIILSYSHTHSALGLGSYGGDEVRKTYRDFVLDTVISLIDECFGDMREGSLSVCKAQSDFGISRRYPSPDGILWKPYDNDDSIDHDLYLLKFEDREGKIRGILYNYACHPTSCGPGNLEITADYPSAVRSMLETEYPESAVMFLQGCGADIKPRMSGVGGRFISLTPEEMTDGAKSLACDIDAGISHGIWKNIEPDIKVRSEQISLPCEDWTREDWEKIACDPGQPEYRRLAAHKAIGKFDRKELLNSLSFTIKCINLSEDVRFICLENEMVNAYGKMIKQRISGDTITLGYTGRICCYIPTVQVLREGGYECDAFLSAGTSGPFKEELEELIAGTSQHLAEK